MASNNVRISSNSGSSLSAQITAMSNVGRIEIRDNETISSNLTVPIGVTLVGAGGTLSVASGVTVTMLGTIEGRLKIFDDSPGGTVNYGYEFASLPAATTVNESQKVWDRTNSRFLYSDGTNWNDALGTVGANPATPTNTVAPAITGSTKEGSTLSCSTGTWTATPTSYTYQWLADDVNIPGATSSTYVTVLGNVDATIKCTVTAINAYGSTAATSSGVGPIIPAAKYYVDGAAGSNSNNGLTPEAPWQTIAHALTNASLSAGEKIAFKRGSTYTPSAQITNPFSSGSIGNHVEVIAYGSGADPIIDASGYTDGINLTARTYMTFRNLKIIGYEQSGIAASSGTFHCYNVECDGTIGSDADQQGFQCTGTSVWVLTDCKSHDNLDDGLSGHTSSNVTMVRGEIYNNSQGINCINSCAYDLTDVVFYGNDDTINIPSTSTMVATGCTFRGKGSGNGGRLVGGGTFTDCIFDFAGLASAAVQIFQVTFNTSLDHCTIYGANGANEYGYIYGNPNTITLTLIDCIFHSIWSLGTNGTGAETINADYCIFHNLTQKYLDTNTNEVAGDPLLVDPANDDFTPGVGSPAIGAASDSTDIGAVQT